MAAAGRARRFWLAGMAAGLALCVLCAAAFLPPQTAQGVGQGETPGPRITFDPALKIEKRNVGPSQQFEIRLRLVLPRNLRGHSIGFRHTVSADQAAPGRYMRASMRLPGPASGPRPYLELSLVTRSR